MGRRLLVLAGILAIVASACGGAGGGTTATAAATLAGASPAKTTRPTVAIKVAYSNITADDLAVWVAQEAGIFKANGLDVDLQYINGGAQTSAALLANQVHVAQFGGGEVLGAVAGGADLIIVGQLAPVYPYHLYVGKNIKTIADLKGKKVGISNAGGSSDIATRDALKKVGLDPDKDVIIIAVGSHANRTAALLSGAIDAGVDDPPEDEELVKAGLTALINIAGQKIPASNTGIVVQRSYLTANRDTVQAYVDSIVQSIAYANKNRDFTVGVLKKYFKSDNTASMENAYTFFLKEVTPAYPIPGTEQLTTAVEILTKLNPKVATVDLNKIVDKTFMQSAQDRKVGQ
ncbi:MAG TPA: ABC transporter substrate-binding protein [Candidatus Limnocylindria bacterium]|nr:ABC transporter substrate-binding protein [Candidatus Limnocylindria bacterium]